MTSIASLKTLPTCLVDNYGRKVNYLRLSITDRCNLRCRYCMPKSGVSFLDHDEILSYEELERLVRAALRLGITKIRITGGEPLVRKGCMEFLRRLKEDLGVPYLHITTNGVLLKDNLAELSRIGLSGINMSLDTVNRGLFRELTRYDRFDAVMQAFSDALWYSIPLKINAVVLSSTTDTELLELASLIYNNPISLRFIELMPFSGSNRQDSYPPEKTLEKRLLKLFPSMTETHSLLVETARRFRLPGAAGSLGIIEGHSRSFCKTCNKIRVTSNGILKNCLYDQGVVDLKAILRNGADDNELATAIVMAVGYRNQDGRQTELLSTVEPSRQTMSKIGG